MRWTSRARDIQGQCWHHGRHHPKIQAPDCTLPNVTCDPMDPCRSVVPCCSAAPILYLTYFTSSHVEIPFRALVLGPDDGRAALFHPSDPLRLYPSLNSYHDDPLSQGLGTLVESAPLEGYSLLQDCGDAPEASANTTYPIVIVAASFIDNHPSQPRPATSKRGAHYNHPQPASITASFMGQFKPGLTAHTFIPGASTYHDHLSLYPDVVSP